MATDQPDVHSTTPLDLLINAIAGSSRYAFPSEGAEGDFTQIADGDAAAVGNESNADAHPSTDGQPRASQKRPRQDRSPSPRQKKIIKTLAAHTVAASTPLASESKSNKVQVTIGLHTNVGGREGTESRIEVWHPTTGQKSYGKERRILAPPPILRVSGAILPLISSVTLSTITNTSTPTPISGSETHHMQRPIVEASLPLPEQETAADAVTTQSGERQKTTTKSKRKADKKDAKRRLREAARDAGFGATLAKTRGSLDGRDRSVLVDGLGFPGLWIGEEVGKMKEFLLDLKIQIEGNETSSMKGPIAGFPDNKASVVGVESDTKVLEAAANASSAAPVGEHTVGEVVSADDLAVELDPASMEVLQPLAEAVRKANQMTDDILADHLQLPAPPDVTQGNSEEANAAIDPTLADVDIDKVIDAKDEDVLPASTASVVKAITTADPWATFTSAPLRIVSKPSQKTAKARSMASCFSVSASFALWTRIHGQTVRTKYMKLEPGDDIDSDGKAKPAKLVSKTGRWTPFKFEVVRRATLPSDDRGHHSSDLAGGDNPDKLTYGSIVRLVDQQSGIKSDPVKLVKVEAGEVRVGEDQGQPISELQRIGLVRLLNGVEDTTGGRGGRWYLSAPGARLGGGELSNRDAASGRRNRAKKAPAAPQTSALTPPLAGTEAPPSPYTLNSIEQVDPMPSTELQDLAQLPQLQATSSETLNQYQDQLRGPADPGPKKRVKTKRNALAAAVLAEDIDGGSQNILTWNQATRNQTSSDGQEGVGAELETVEDWMSWIIGGVSCFTYSFFPSSEDPSSAIQAVTIDPIPRILIPPVFHSGSNTLSLHLSEFFFPSSSASTVDSASSPSSEPLEVYLGPIGPLYVTTWRSTAPKDSPTPAIPYHQDDEKRSTALHASKGLMQGESDSGVMSAFPADLKHVIVVVHMPDHEEIISAMQSCAAQASTADVAAATMVKVSLQDTGDSVEQGGAAGAGHSNQTPPDEESRNRGLSQASQAQTQPGQQDTEGIVAQEQSKESEHTGSTPDNLSIAAALDLAPSLNAFESYNPFSETGVRPDPDQGLSADSHLLMKGADDSTVVGSSDSAENAVEGGGRAYADMSSQAADPSTGGRGGDDQDQVIDPSLRESGPADPDRDLRGEKAIRDGDRTDSESTLPLINADSARQIEGRSLADPKESTEAPHPTTLHLYSPAEIPQSRSRSRPASSGQEQSLVSPPISQTGSERRKAQSLVPLPLLLLRRSDGLVFRTNRSMVAERRSLRLPAGAGSSMIDADMDMGVALDADERQGSSKDVAENEYGAEHDHDHVVRYGGETDTVLRWQFRVVEDRV